MKTDYGTRINVLLKSKLWVCSALSSIIAKKILTSLAH